MPKNREKAEFAPLPSTLKRSPKKAQDTYEKTLESAENEYGGDEARTHRVAWSAVKHGFEKVGDRWEPKAETGPSDPRSSQPHDAKVAGAGETGVEHRSHLTKNDLAREIAKKQRRS